jgi:hypothetical protein
MIADTHHIFAQQKLLILDLFEENLKRISRVEHPYWPRVLVHDGDVLQAALLHDRPDVVH